MRYLLDTQYLIWFMHDDKKRISKKIRQVFEKESGQFGISIVSLWEMTIKKSLNKLRIDDSFLHIAHKLDISILPITIGHLQNLQRLPHHHKDPFDRLLVAQAITEKLTLLTSDKELARYGAKIMLA